MSPSLDIQIGIAGQRMIWEAVSMNAIRWAETHPEIVQLAPENVEQYHGPVDQLILHAWRDGLTIGLEPDDLIYFRQRRRVCLRWRAALSAA